MNAKPCSLRTVHRPGFTLLEVLLVMIALGVVVTLSLAMVLGTWRIEQASAAALQHQTVEAQLADQFRADVAHAVATPDRLGAVTAGATCLILRGADGRHVVYRWQAQRLERSEVPVGAEKLPQVLLRATDYDSAAVEFRRSGADRGLLSLELVKTHGRAKRTLEIAAALGGDHR
jgi:prepilin-type N-terminal cleavage/methylation domain-containing protein